MNVVQKYNGRCVDSIEKIQAIAKYVATTKKEGDGLVIVASAMGRTTDRLLRMAKEVGDDVPKRELDALLATGEQQTVALMAIALSNLGIEAVSVTGFQSGFITNDYHTHARIKEINTEKVEKIINQGKVAIVAGFQGISEDGDVTTLGRGGSDVTAVAIAAHLGWDCEVYTTTDCLYTVDPKIYKEAKPLSQITYEEMMELANLGADKLETRSVELAKKYGVKLFLGKSMETDKSKGTYIMNNENLLVEDMPITGMSVQEDIVIFSLKNINNDGKTVAECFKMLGEIDINVDMISQQSTGKDTCSVSFSCTKQQGKDLKQYMKTSEIFKGVEVTCDENLAMISVVGVGMATHSGIASEVFSVLAANDIKYYHITTSEISISVTVDIEWKVKAAIALCQAFDL
ncbi:MAG: aspartate kinase [Anaerovoracaceae bacterium]